MARAADNDEQPSEPDSVGVTEELSEELKKLEGMTLGDVLAAGHEALVRLLVAKVRCGSASPQEQAILRNILRDNGLTLGFGAKTIDGEVVQPQQARLPHDVPRQLPPPRYDEE